MRVDALKLPQAALQHSKVHGTGKPFPGIPAENANAQATSQRPTTENIAAQTQPTTGSERAEKLTPAGLLAAQLRFQAMDSSEMTRGQSRALEVITRNLERYQAHAGTTGTTPPATAPDTSAATPTSGSEATTSAEATPPVESSVNTSA